MIEVIVTLTAHANKYERLCQIIHEMSVEVERHEGSVSRYQCLKDELSEGQIDIVVIERYETQEAYEQHKNTTHVNRLINSLETEALLAKPYDIKRLVPLIGYDKTK